MKTIVVLDAYTLSPLAPNENSPLHPSWEAMAALGQLQLHPRTSPEDVIERARDAEIVLTNKTPLTAGQIQALPRLQYIGVMATGTNVVDLAAARSRGIPVTNIPGYSTMSVAQHVFALLLEMASRTGATDAAVKKGEWVQCPDFCFTVAPFDEMVGRTLGLVGFGAIGQAVARIGAAFGMKIAVHSRSKKPTDLPVDWVTLDELLERSDVVSLHCPLTDSTHHLINQESLARMKSHAYLINTSRGPLIDEAALADSLKAGHLAGFGTDVLSSEPPRADNPILTAPRTVVTPHMAWASLESRTRLMQTLVSNVQAFLAGTPTHVVN